jgi:hypothetical protein
MTTGHETARPSVRLPTHSTVTTSCALTMRHYAHTDLKADHMVARALADLILSNVLLANPDDEDPVSKSVSTGEENAR